MLIKYAQDENRSNPLLKIIITKLWSFVMINAFELIFFDVQVINQ